MARELTDVLVTVVMAEKDDSSALSAPVLMLGTLLNLERRVDRDCCRWRQSTVMWRILLRSRDSIWNRLEPASSAIIRVGLLKSSLPAWR